MKWYKSNVIVAYPLSNQPTNQLNHVFFSTYTIHRKQFGLYYESIAQRVPCSTYRIRAYRRTRFAIHSRKVYEHGLCVGRQFSQYSQTLCFTGRPNGPHSFPTINSFLIMAIKCIMQIFMY
jgi:hypothetical protein